DAPKTVLDKYEVLSKDQLQARTFVIDPKVVGQRNLNLPWFWHMDVGKTGDASQYMIDFYRVQWLRCKARRDRWQEEYIRVLTEMQAFVLYCQHHARQWKARQERSDQLGELGHASYAAGRVAMWTDMGEEAKTFFEQVVSPGDMDIAFNGREPVVYPDVYRSLL
ncbi:hypothetical protein DENSPDRAFT_789644, partial [Dentipellis sp. KUC8613]